MNINYNKIIKIKSLEDLTFFQIDKPLLNKNYIFHYLTIVDNLDGLKLKKFPVFIENNDGLNCFHLAAKESNIDILYYLIDNYSDYIYNRNKKKETFINYLDYTNIIILIKKYPDLDWNYLIDNNSKKILNNILININYTDLIEFIKYLKLKLSIDNYQYLFSIINNYNITTEEKIKIFNDYSDDKLNVKNDNGEGIILTVININDNILFNYLLERNIDIDYYTAFYTYNPLRRAIYFDIIYNTNFYVIKLLNKLYQNNKNFYNDIDKYGDNIFHTLINIRLNRNYQIKFINSNINIDNEIFKYSDTESMNKLNISKISPLELLVELNYDDYFKIIKNDIIINPNIINNITNNKKKIDNRWIELYKLKIKQNPNYSIDNYDINMEIYEYSHYTLFQSKFTDIGLYVLYLEDTYLDLIIPKQKFYILNNLTFDNIMPFPDELIMKEPIFPWIISFYSENEYYIHPYLNKLINQYRLSYNKRICCVFLSIYSNNLLHANILIYDFKKMTIERFEPYGNLNSIDEFIDIVLEEELTWNTGLCYIKTSDYLPMVGFQNISDENNLLNQKPGDFGGFCLAWCMWYLETKLKNIDVESKILVSKLISKLNNLDIKYSEYIRNYSNKINKERIKYLELIGINPKEISNSYESNDTEIKLTNFLISKYSS